MTESAKFTIDRRNFLRLGGAVVAGAALPGVLTSCGGGSPSSKSSGSGLLRIAQDSSVSTLDPQKQGSMTDMSVLSNVFDFLTHRTSDGKLVGGLATSWEAVNDTTWRFHLRKGVKFHNGEPFNADVAKFSIDRLLDPKTKSPIVELVHVTGTKVVDEYAFELTTKAPDPLIPTKVSLFGGVMVPPKYIKENGDDHFASNPVGTGPFKFESWQRDAHVKLSSNGDYYDGTPKVESLTFRPIPNPSTAVSALKAGEIEIAGDLTQTALQQLKGDSSIKEATALTVRTYSVGLNTLNGGPMANTKVRQALNYAVNVEQLVNTVLGGHARQVATMLPRQAFGYDPSVKPYPYDPDKAKKLLTEAGYRNGFSTKLTAQNTDKDIVQAIAGMLRNAGVDAKVNLIDPGTFEEGLLSKHSAPLGPMFFYGNTGWTMDASSYLQSEIRSGRKQNLWHSDRTDELIDTQATNVDPKVRKKAFSELQHIIKKQAIRLFLYQVEDVYPMQPSVQWKPNPIGLLWMKNASINS